MCKVLYFIHFQHFIRYIILYKTGEFSSSLERCALTSPQLRYHGNRWKSHPFSLKFSLSHGIHIFYVPNRRVVYIGICTNHLPPSKTGNLNENCVRIHDDTLCIAIVHKTHSVYINL